jgi:hypothetical protein
MKKQILSTSVIVGCIFLMQSCATFTPCTTMTGYLAPVYSSLPGDASSWKGTFGAQGGVEANIPFKDCKLPLTAWAGLNLSMQGAGWEEDFGGEVYKGVTRLWYLNVPLTGRYTFENGLYGEFGIQPGFLLSAKDKESGDSFDYKDYIKLFDLSIPFGIGYNFPNNFGLNLRIIPGVTNVNKGEEGTYMNRNFVTALRVTYTIPGKER